MKRCLFAAVLLLCAVRLPAQTPDMKARWLSAVTSFSNEHPDFGIVTARLNLHRDTALAYRQLDTLIEHHYGDMFWAMWTAATYYATQDVLRPDYKLKIRAAWKRFTPYRGDTENHFLMYYTAWFLMAQAFPDDPSSEWFNGKSSKENYDDARDFLVHWVEETARFGQTEWDSPRYGYYYITPLILLSEYTRDEKLRKLFRQALDLMLADYALDYLDGSYCGAHSRVSDAGAIDARHNEISVYGSYFFGDKVENVREDVAFAALSKYECPKIIRDIARDRTKPFESFEFKRGRNTIRHSNMRNAPVYRYTYMTPAYALGSMQGGIVQPIQQQSWSLVINSDTTPNVITGLNPYVDSAELTMFFPEYPEFMMERIGAVKQGYPNESKWVGGSPYEHIYQDKNLLIARYDLPDSVKYHHVDLFIPPRARHLDLTSLVDSEYQQPAWHVLQMDSVFIGVRMLAPYKVLDHGSRWRSSEGKTGYAIYCEAGASLYAFKKKLESLSARVTSGGLKSVEKVQWLYRSPYVNSKRGSGLVTLTHGKDKLVLDFTK